MDKRCIAMIRVIGNDPKILQNCTCKRCGSILEYAPRDIQQNNYTDMSMTKCIQEYIVCPSCATKIILNDL